MGFYLSVKVVLFLFCLVISTPFTFINPAYFANGTSGFVYRWIDDLLKYEVIDKEQHKNLKDEFERG